MISEGQYAIVILSGAELGLNFVMLVLDVKMNLLMVNLADVKLNFLALISEGFSG